MDHLQKIDTANNLLLNLLVRETENWYFFDIIPRYDEALARYMQSFSSKGFLRFELPSLSRILYFPIVYRSLSSMHHFGDYPAYRIKQTEELVPIPYQEAILLLLKEEYTTCVDQEICQVLNTLNTNYNEAVKTVAINLIPTSFLADSPHESSNAKLMGTKVIAAEALINEYGNCENLGNLLALITGYASTIGQAANTVIMDWTKQYCDCLLRLTLECYSTRNSIVLPNLQSIEVVLDEKHAPTMMRFVSDSPVILHKELPETYNHEKIEQLLNTHLLTHHIFPLLRAFGLLGLAKEEQLLHGLAETFTEFKNKYGSKANFLSQIRTHVKAFLPELLHLPPAEFAWRELHIHNHSINKQFYAKKLIKPDPGEMVHTRYFNGGSVEIGIRGFDITTDLEIIHEWVNQDYAKKFWEMDGPIQQLEEAYIKHLGVDYSHPYIGTLNGEPIFTLELYWATKDEVGKYYPFHPGDYGFHMLIAPAKQRIPNFSYYALTMCMEHFFTFSQVHRIIGEASVEHMGTHNLITKVGCAFDQALVLPYKTANLTFLTREMYLEAVKDVLERSRTEILVNI